MSHHTKKKQPPKVIVFYNLMTMAYLSWELSPRVMEILVIGDLSSVTALVLTLSAMTSSDACFASISADLRSAGVKLSLSADLANTLSGRMLSSPAVLSLSLVVSLAASYFSSMALLSDASESLVVSSVSFCLACSTLCFASLTFSLSSSSIYPSSPALFLLTTNRPTSNSPCKLILHPSY